MPDGVTKAGWTRVTFGEVVELSRERSSDPEGDGLERYVGLEHIEPGDLKIRRWGSTSDGTTFNTVFRSGQVLFGKRRAYQRKVAVADFDGVCSGDIYVLKAKPPHLLPGLLPFICQTEGFFEHAVGTSAGSLSPRTKWESLASYEFALPPLEEQRRICSLVVAANAVIDLLSDCITHCAAIVESIRTSRFDPLRYKSVRLVGLCDDRDGIQIGPFGAQLHQSDYQADGVPVIMPLNMKDGRIDVDGIARVSERKARSLEIYRVRKGDILLPRRGELDRRALVDESADGWLCGTGSVRVRPQRQVSSIAVFHALASPHTIKWLNGNAVGTTMPNLNTTIVGNVPIALPPIDVLDRILAALQALDTGLAALRVRQAVASTVRQQILKTALEAG